ncbi:LytTR family DNA-binding domain-containing protein [Terrimonas sp. NA20]|uniref:LytTR family DNA-binding domain-containing protein n=1 Tax=Terrimonas ginsenosidimutans TaxID=2908004 RepID=A0ABS9KZR8_9BACT|nr:LytTR family DNA-binding domain-containing protein [Terrimonas ginsenosidimutans]MCG2617824.1 LytTR family DNA-binding domain-containing protein [Terrimonas ginsenosidimutans]
MKIQSLIIDDEPLARKGMREYVGEIDFLSVAGEFDNPVKAMEELSRRQDIQLLFLDIQMPKLSGLDFLRSVQPSIPVILTTAYPQFALDGFELNVLDYLVKPISFDRFYKSALRAKEYYEVRESNRTDRSQGNDHFFIKADNKLVKIFLRDVLFVEALQNYVVIQTPEKKFITYLTFRSVEEYLTGAGFIKTHKSFIVAAGRIDTIEGNNIRIGSYDIPISRNLKEEVMEQLLKGKFLKR